MTPVGKAIWFVESHFAEDISLDDIAAASGVSRYHLVRAFGFATGTSVMRYLRGRRLSEAARALARGAPDILSVALEAVRARRTPDTLDLVEPIKMDETLFAKLDAPRFESGKPLLVAGLGERYNGESSKAIPSLWQRFQPYLGNISGAVGSAAYGVCCNGDDEGNFDYIAGVEVKDFSALPAEFSRVRIPAQRYALFRHAEHISTIRRTVNTIWSRWLPQSGHEAADAPNFERYAEAFDPRTGLGG